MDIQDMWDHLLGLGVSQQTLELITSINGYSKDTLDDVLYAHTGYRSFEQMEDED